LHYCAQGDIGLTTLREDNQEPLMVKDKVKLEEFTDDERQFKTAQRSQAPGDATVL